MKENNRKVQNAPLIYAVIGVAVLVVAIAGSTFAYFSASATAENKIVGTAATVGLELTLEDVSAKATGKLIPLDEANLTKAAVGDGTNGACVDKNSNTVCKIYKITATNTSTATAILSGTVNIKADTGSTFTNLKWNKMTSATVPGATATASFPIATTALTTNESYTAGASKTYYIMVYINNLNSNQSAQDTGSFTGTVSFNSASGSEVKAAFSS